MLARLSKNSRKSDVSGSKAIATRADSDKTNLEARLSYNEARQSGGSNGTDEMASSCHKTTLSICTSERITESEYAELLERYKANEQNLQELRKERNELRDQLTCETSNALKYETDNELLREQIRDMSRGRDPIHDEGYYISEYTLIRANIESWAAKETRTMTKQPLSQPDFLTIVSELEQCGDHGKRASEWLNSKDRKMFQERRHRIALICHVTAIVLFDRVFDRYVFGFGEKTSRYFEMLEEQIFKKENYPFATILQIRQAIGRAAMVNDTESCRESVIQKLVLLLCILVPNAQDKVQSLVVKSVDKATSLRIAMTEEQAIYRCYFCNNGDLFDKDWMNDPTEETANGRISMCTFPGLRRFIVKNETREFIAVVKATTKV